jgi:hypothetical protein
LHIGRYALSNKPHAKKEVKAMKEICLCTGNLKGHDPHNIVYDHIKFIKLTYQVIHEVNFVEDLFKGDFFVEEVLQRLQDESTRENFQKEEDEERSTMTKQFRMLLEKGKRKYGC